MCKDAGVDDLATVTGRIDLADPDGQFQARILGAVAKKDCRPLRRGDDLALVLTLTADPRRPKHPRQALRRPPTATRRRHAARVQIGGDRAHRLTRKQALRALLDHCRLSRSHRQLVRLVAIGPATATGDLAVDRQLLVLAPDAAALVVALSSPSRRPRRSVRCFPTRRGGRTGPHGAISCTACSAVATAANGSSPVHDPAGSAAMPAPRASASPVAARPTSLPIRLSGS